ncbi:ribonuclease H-like protein [Exidia glandulosa HHB12029]|uniref:ribonuclease H n=1 Tax=Exidia glandulosa HHB12029 TaxID=1314781 RepID=A0A165IDM9_EXIGL|nr:ribonuclease H-like protein [Exidia glandulosa HHB12029]
MGIGENVLVRDFMFCDDHGQEWCGRCCCDHRMCNNIRIEEYVDEYTDEDMAIEAREAIADDRPPLSLHLYGLPTNRRDEENERIWVCREHGVDSCSTCFDFVCIVLESFGVYEVVDTDNNESETGSSDSSGPPPLVDVYADVAAQADTTAHSGRVVEIQPTGQRAGPPHETLSGNPLYRVNYVPVTLRRRPVSGRTTNAALIESMSRADCPRRFVPPTQDTRPQDLFRQRADFSGNRFLRYLHRGDDHTMLVYTDGACLDQGGPQRRGGCGIVFCDSLPGQKHALEGTIGGPEQTSKRAELRAVLFFLQLRVWESGGAQRIVVATDSEYVVEGACVRLAAWVRRGWRTAEGRPVANRDLWEALLNELERSEQGDLRILFWRISRALNARADTLAKEAADMRERSSEPGLVFGILM